MPLSQSVAMFLKDMASGGGNKLMPTALVAMGRRTHWMPHDATLKARGAEDHRDAGDTARTPFHRGVPP